MLTLHVLPPTCSPSSPFPKLEELDKDTQHGPGTGLSSQILLEERPLDEALMKYCSGLCQAVMDSDPQHPQGADSHSTPTTGRREQRYSQIMVIHMELRKLEWM